MELREIAADVCACLQEDRGLGWSNSGFVNRGGGLVVDTFWDLPLTRRMIELYSGVSSDPPRRLVNTHHNGDHCWGNQLLRGAEIIGHRLCAEEMQKGITPEAFRAMAGSADLDPALRSFVEALGEFDFSGIEITPPTTLIEDRLDLDLDGRAAQIVYVGPAHTAGDVIVFLPEERVLFGGDVMWRYCTPIGWEGTFERWFLALDRMIDLAPEVIVPGHGPPCGVDGVRELRAYLEYVVEESRSFFEQGLSAIDAAKRIDLGPYSGWTEPERLIFNVDRAYRELRGEPWDTPVDAIVLLRQMYALRRHREAAGS
jgi:glyoxylase-like metal-dependent hydrolase (beta-lactamase superfamily II)